MRKNGCADCPGERELVPSRQRGERLVNIVPSACFQNPFMKNKLLEYN